MTQASHEYEKIREVNPKIGKVEKFVNYSLIPISTVITLSVYNHLNNLFPYQPTENQINGILDRGGEVLTNPNPGGWPGAIPYGFHEIKTREEAIEYLIDADRSSRMGGYFVFPFYSALMAYLITILGINPGEKILKSSYTLGKTVRDSMGRIKYYLKGMKELKQKRIEVNKNER